MSIREFAKITGVSHPYISQIETGKINNPSADTLRKLAKGLEIPYLQMLWEAGLNELYEKEKYKEALEEFAEKEDLIEIISRLRESENNIQANNVDQVRINDSLTEQVVNEENLYDLNRVLKQISKPVKFDSETLTDNEKEMVYDFIKLILKHRK